MLTFQARHRVLLPTLAICLTLLSACSSTSSTDESANASVASLATPTTAEKTGAKPPVAERPLVRPDTSEAELARMNKVFLNCLRANGVPRSAVKGTWDNGSVSADLAAKYTKQCGSKQPQQLFDKARASDPEFADHLRADLTCLNQHGIRAETRKDGDVWLLDDLPPNDKAHWLDDCEQQAFSSYYKSLS